MATTPRFFPPAYKHFVDNGLDSLEPWQLCDAPGTIDAPPDFERHRFASKQCKRETGAQFDLYLFARRTDMDDFAFFVVRDNVIEDKVFTIHLSFVNKMELRSPLRYEQVQQNFMDWVRTTAMDDMQEAIGCGDD